ncbi:MAG: hypothetical protein M3Y09_01465 [Actinomycetota bacterium]|nr:hypothetical protein [Actinomycetota bacterium]
MSVWIRRQVLFDPDRLVKIFVSDSTGDPGTRSSDASDGALAARLTSTPPEQLS